ncbi:MAG TPA: alpha/beta fold hydrolase, partial [Crenalkalicoccus sp.]|nr:alpha/beta fold hydrolase [Crenalkalicoccus sp.]
LLLGAALGACVPVVRPAGPAVVAPAIATDALLMPDGARLPLHAWLPQGPPRAVLLALHGFNDYSVDFMEDAAPRFAAAGIAVYAYDQRGFGAAPNRGIWPGARTLVADAGTAARLIKARHPGLPLFMLGESMGAAVIILAASGPAPPPAAGYLLLAPALWGRAGMNAAMRWGLWLASRTIPVVGFRGGVAGITPTDNEAALRRWMNDPLTLKSTRVDAAHGLVDLMDAAVAALPACCRAEGVAGLAPTLVLSGGRDQIVPTRVARHALTALPEDGPVRIAFYPKGYHLLLRDKDASQVEADILAWMAAPAAPLPSGADRAGRDWVEEAGP